MCIGKGNTRTFNVPTLPCPERLVSCPHMHDSFPSVISMSESKKNKLTEKGCENDKEGRGKNGQGVGV